MYPIQHSKRRSRAYRFSAESLESRELLTGGAGDTFAVVPAAITTAGQTTTVKFTIDGSHWTIPKNTLALGIDVVANTGSTVQPLIGSVNNPNGTRVSPMFHSIYDPKLLKAGQTSGIDTTAVLTELHLKRGWQTSPQTFSVTVSGMNKTTGSFLLGFYLPGDANGDGVVDKTDVKTVKSEMGAHSITTGTKYTFDADANRDGHITSLDLKYTNMNLGVKTTISPVVSANIDQSTDPLLTSGTTTNDYVIFTGAATPSASLSFQDAAAPSAAPVGTTADNSTGDYSVTLPLVSGSNTYQITSLDAFGQSIQGSLAAVNYQTNTSANTAAALATLTSLGSGTTSAVSTSGATTTTTTSTPTTSTPTSTPTTSTTTSGATTTTTVS